MFSHTFFLLEGNSDSSLLDKLESKLTNKYPNLHIELDTEEGVNLHEVVQPTLFLKTKLILSESIFEQVRSFNSLTFWVIDSVKPGLLIRDPNFHFHYLSNSPSPVIKGTGMVMDFLSWSKI